MQNLLKLEELGLFLLAIFLFSQLGFDWYWFIILLFVPDISMMGYLVNAKIGATIYNFFHHKFLAVIVYLVGVWFGMDLVMLVGVILLAHSSLDRVLGYGLKLITGFKDTHLGRIGGEVVK